MVGRSVTVYTGAMAEPSLELLQVMVQRVLDRQEEHSQEFKELRARMLSVERAVLSIRGDMIGDAHVDSNLQSQIDHVRTRIDRIERRLDFAD